MNIAFLTPSVSRALGGIYEIERRLGQSLAENPGTQVSVYGLQDAHTAADAAEWGALQPKAFPVVGPAALGYSPELQKAFSFCKADVGHLHALWMYTSIVIRDWSRKSKRPYIVTPNGMLDPWALRNSGWKKCIAGALYERSMLAGAGCIQANTEKEAADIRAYGLKNPIAIIPNGVDLPDLTGGVTDPHHPIAQLRAAGRKVLLYLGRIHPKKGLLNLVRAWAALPKREDWVLAIAGWDQGGHERELQQLATELGVAWADARAGVPESALSHATSLMFLGPQFGNEKKECYRGCDAFILPSFSEGVPMVILEAWSYGKLVLMTPECNIPEGFARRAALRIETDQAAIQRGLTELFALSPAERMALGAEGRNMVIHQYSWQKVATEMKRVYEWLLGGERPESIVIK